MKKEGFLVIFVSIVIIILILNYNPIQKRGMEEVTTKGILDTMATISASILVDADAPNVIIDSPENKSYFSENNIELNYITNDVSGVDSVWYNLDNGNNHTLTDNITFNTNEGSHSLYIFAEDNHGFLNNREFVSFFVGNASEENVVDENGDSIFNDTTIKEIINKISNLPVGASVNTTLYNNTKPSNWITPSSTLVETTFKYFEVAVNESTSGGSYTIYFNLTSAELGSTNANDIRLFIYENTEWEELTTNVIDSSSNLLSFSAITTHFSQFLIGKKGSGETPVPTGGVVGGSETAGGAKEKISSFSVDNEFIKVLVKKGDILKRTIKITNTGNTFLDFVIDLQELKDVIYVSEPSFRLDKGKEKLIDLSIMSGKGIAPGVYVGNIAIKAGENILKLVRTIIEVESEKILFDISLDIPLEYKNVNPGEELILHSTLINMGGLSDVDINIEYNIKNSKGELILKDEEIVVVGTQASFTKKFLIPKNLEFGEYVISAVVRYGDSIGTSSEIFMVGEFKEKLNILNVLLVVGILVLLIFTSFWQRKNLKDIEKLQKERLEKLKEKKEVMPKPELKTKLGKELKLLEKSYEAKYITKDAYLRSKDRIMRMLK